MRHRPWTAEQRDDPEAFAAALHRWADSAVDSPLYEHLARRIAEDPRMRAVVAQIDRVPPLNLLFGGVRMALTPEHPLAAWYPVLVGDAAREPDDELWDVFRAYVLEHEQELVEIGCTRRTQTNEAGRSAAVLPWIVEAGRRWQEPLHLVDLGTSAGLNLCMDRYDHDYGDGYVPAGNPASTRLTLRCENRGGFTTPAGTPRIATRTGLDLDPVDATDADQAAWLEALVWPEHVDRLHRLRQALAIRAETAVNLVKGDAVALVPQLDRLLPPGPIVLMHTVMAYQLAPEQQVALDAACLALSRTRQVARVSMEPAHAPTHTAIRTGLTRTTATNRATAHSHGRWIDR
ncbi:DUF2332 domain-containing protein [Demequina capsici]|uniref:DUF2332 domain-containing protein n=1 Tax=Demequina capsici TaxID=3075620 RepID=A0AA96FCF0_9MICO|nr:MULTISPECIES: DUF2332 domain-containing protein [unclassified Demequina]WNM24350.1 DUF2332 domain-containing protein [Demequina sp. OYTSA14]WNM27172.1 DUF2332 domain-containing protein [Demequina sp. PMTSA13]